MSENSDKIVQFSKVYTVYIDYGSIIYDGDNYVRLDKSETFRLDYDSLLYWVKNYFPSMLVGAIFAIFLLSFLPNLMEMVVKGYQSQVVVDFAIDHMVKDYTPKPAAVQTVPKAWLIPVVGVVFATALRKFFVSE